MANLDRWIITNHPFFRETKSKVLGELKFWGPLAIDDIVVATQRPLRTVLLCVESLVDSGYIQAKDGDLVLPTSAGKSRFRGLVRDDLSVKDEAVHRTYCNATDTKPEAALLWSQRALTRQSAFKRAAYILQKIPSRPGNVVFLGDDDLVSPLVAAYSSDTSVTVIDIDKSVLNKVEEISCALNTKITTLHADLSNVDLVELGPFSLVVADPFPSKDGSFERFFWLTAFRLIKADGLLITTTFPSHKPLEFSKRSIDLLSDIGFLVSDIRLTAGHYEILPYDILEVERNIINKLALRPTVHHTKALLCAKRISNSPNELTLPGGTEFSDWVDFFRGHYLTQAAGPGHQERIIQDRGVNSPEDPTENPKFAGLEVGLILPHVYANYSEVRAGKSDKSLARCVTRELDAKYGLTVSEADLQILFKASGETSGFENIAGTRLALAIRSLESWAR